MFWDFAYFEICKLGKTPKHYFFYTQKTIYYKMRYPNFVCNPQQNAVAISGHYRQAEKRFFHPIRQKILFKKNNAPLSPIAFNLQRYLQPAFFYCAIYCCFCIGIFPSQSIAFAQQIQEGYHITLHLSSKPEQPILVELLTPTPTSDIVTFVLPLNTHDAYGQQSLSDVIQDFAAFDRQGRRLPHQFVSENGIDIGNAKKLYIIKYWVLPSVFSNLKSQDIEKKDIVLKTIPAYLLARGPFFGYLENYLNFSYKLNIYKPAELLGSTALPLVSVNDTCDFIALNSYQALLDNALLYALPDTFSFVSDKTRYHIALYAPNPSIKARHIYYILEPTIKAVNALAPQVSIQNSDYWFLFVFEGKNNDNIIRDAPKLGGTCSITSALFRLPETSNSRELYRRLQPIAAHELLHRLTPFALHSKKVHYNGLDNEGMGQHLWLYEGVTEYLTWLALVRGGLITENDFWREMSKKATVDAQFPQMSLTESSQKIFKPRFAAQYPNFYARAPLTAFFIDILLQKNNIENKQAGKEIKGQEAESLLQLLKLLQQRLPQPFVDDSLFVEIEKLCPPTVNNFIENCLKGKQPLPYNTILGNIGIAYWPQLNEKRGTFGQFGVVPDYKKEQIIINRVGNDALAFRRGDIIISLNGQDITTGNMNNFLPLLYEPEPEKPLEITLLRADKKLTLSLLPEIYYSKQRHLFMPQKKPTDKQVQLLTRIFY